MQTRIKKALTILQSCLCKKEVIFMYFVKYGDEYLHNPNDNEHILSDLALDYEENSWHRSGAGYAARLCDGIR